MNRETGEKSNCSDNSHWIQEFVIPAGSLVREIKAGNEVVEYVVKPLDIEQSMLKVDNSKCTEAGLSFPDLQLPDSTKWKDPAIGSEPEVTKPFSIIAGAKTSAS